MVIKNERTDNQRGFTLVELLVAAAIGLTLLGIIGQVFVSSTRAYSRNESMSRIQENGRFAMSVLRNSAAGAGYLGCSQDMAQFQSIVAVGSRDFYINDYDQFVYGLEWVSANPGAADELTNGDWRDQSNTYNLSSAAGFMRGDPVNGIDGMVLPADALTGSDIVTFRTINSGPEAVLLSDSGTTLNIPAGINSIARATNVGANEENRRPLLIADCTASRLFYGNSYIGTTLDLNSARNQSANLGQVFETGSQVFTTEITTYYLRNNNNAVPSLYRTIGSGLPEELIEGVENMQVRYGVDTSATQNRIADNYVAANAVNDWSRVVSVRIGLLLRSPNQLIRGNENAVVYSVNGTNITAPGDRRIRMVMNITAGLRNLLR